MVLRRAEGDDGPPALVGSGTERDLRTAMRKAARMADRLVGLPGGMRHASRRPLRGSGDGAPSVAPGAIRSGAEP